MIARIIAVIGVVLVATGLAAQDAGKTWNFDADKIGNLSAGFTSQVGEWKVVADPTAPSKPNVLAQQAKNSGSSLFMLVIIGLDRAYAADIDEAEKVLGVTGQMQEGAIVFSFPRSDIKITIDGKPVPTAFGFGSWTAWKEMGKESMVMGDLVLLEKEINPVISALAEANISVTALHNHFLGEEPRIMYMHIGGMGPAAAMAKGIRNALDKTGTPKTQASTSAPALALDTKRIEEIIGHPGKAGGGIFKITLGRPGVKMDGVELTASMGLNTWAAFIGTNEHAHVAGDVAMTASEVNKVIRALRKGGIDLTAVHNHMLDEQPRIFFLHYWGTGPAEKLAQTVREAFDQAKGPVQ